MKKLLPYFIMTLALIVTDFIQYDIYINNHVYTLIFIVLLFFTIISRKTDNFYIILFCSFLIFTDITRYFYLEKNYNTVFFGSLKYFVIIIAFLHAIKKKIVNNKSFLLYSLGAIAFISIGIIRMNPLSHTVSDVLYYINLFLLPILLLYILDDKGSRMILYFYKVYVYSYPIAVIILLLVNRMYYFQGHKYVIAGFMTVFNIAYIIGNMEQNHNKKLNLFYLAIYLFIFALSPSSGDILLLIFLLLYLVIMRTKNINIYLKITCVVLILLTFYIVITMGFNFIITSELIDNPFLKYKVKQIQSLTNFTNIDALPFSVRVRIGEMISILKDNYNVDIFLGKGFGGYFTDSLGTLYDLDTTAFTLEEIISGKFYRAHFFISNIFLKFGILGILFLIRYFTSSLTTIKFRYAEFIPVLFVVVYSSFYGVKTIFIWSFLLGSILEQNYNKNKLDG